jgi:hypothetical protein
MHALEVIGGHEGSDLPEYPIASAERLDSHYFIQWNMTRWRASDFRRRSYNDPEVGFFGFELFCLSQDETPVGTLPCDDKLLAFMLHMPLEQWQNLAGRSLSPLHGWSKVICDTGEIRLAHPVVTEVAVDAITGKRRNSTKNADDRMRKRLGTVAKHLREGGIMGGDRIASDEELLNKLSDWIEDAYPGGSATLKRVKEALNELAR